MERTIALNFLPLSDSSLVTDDIEATKYKLFSLLKENLQNNNIGFRQNNYRLHIVTEKTPYGERSVWMEPCYLERWKLFGFLIDYEFLCYPRDELETKYRKNYKTKILEMSFEIDNEYKSNASFHIDKFRYLSNFAKEFLPKISYLPEGIKIQNKFILVKCEFLNNGKRKSENDPNHSVLKVDYYAEKEHKKLHISTEVECDRDNLTGIVYSISSMIGKRNNHKICTICATEKVGKDILDELKNTFLSVNDNVSLNIVIINKNSGFFGYDVNNNSLVPYKYCYVNIGKNKFLVWTDGLTFDRNLSLKKCDGPVYIEIYYSNYSDSNWLLQKVLSFA